MPELAAVQDAIAAVRAAVDHDVATVAAAIDTAVGDIDQQLATLHQRREELEAALAAVNDQIAAVDGHRDALIAARAQAPAEREDGARSLTQRPVEEEGGDGGDGEDGEDGAYLEFTEDELDPAVARTERIVTVLTRAQQPMRSAEIADILNQFGDTTTGKVVSGTLSSLIRRGAVTKAGPGSYTAAGQTSAG